MPLLHTPALFFEGFSLSKVSLLSANGADDIEGVLYGASSVTFEPEIESYDEFSNEKLVGVWSDVRRVSLSVEAGYASLAVWSKVTGSTVNVAGLLNQTDHKIGMPLWEYGRSNMATMPLRITFPAKDTLGNPKVVEVVLFKVKFKPPTLTGAQYKEGMKVTYEGTVMLSATDEKGQVLEREAFGRMDLTPEAWINPYVPEVAAAMFSTEFGWSNAEPSVLTVGTSPWAWTNTTGGAVRLSIETPAPLGFAGSGVSSVELSKDGLVWHQQGLTPGVIFMLPGEAVRITYTEKPIVKYFPMYDLVGGGVTDNTPVTLSLTTVSTDYTLTVADEVVAVDAANGPVTVTLPPAHGLEGKELVIKKVDATVNVVTVDGAGADLIDGQSTQTLIAPQEALSVVSDNNGWMIV